RPVAVIVSVPRSVARDRDVARFTPTAAATLMPPLLVDALGVEPAPPLPEPSCAADVDSANVRCAAMLPSTPLPAAPPVESPGAPVADAVASALVSEELFALSETAPAAPRCRASFASVMWFAIVSASERPIAADDPSADPAALVRADAV